MKKIFEVNVPYSGDGVNDITKWVEENLPEYGGQTTYVIVEVITPSK